MRFYELAGGRITLDGVDTAAMTRDDLRSRTGMVLQDTWLFRGDHSRQHRLRPARCDRRGSAGWSRRPTSTGSCNSLPDGYDTVLEDEGGNVSAGEKQLITIARAFLAKPSCVHPRRGDLVGGHPHGAVGSARDERAGAGPHVVRRSPTGSPRSGTPTSSWSWRPAPSSSTARTTSCCWRRAYARLYEAQFAAPLAEEEPPMADPRLAMAMAAACRPSP
ncbi:MAG: ATP-binding cassette domain-containing protein [Schumannella sp.]